MQPKPYTMKKITLSLAVGFTIVFAMAYFIYPEPGKQYTGFWYGLMTGGFHGALLIPNWIISLFDSTRIIKATDCSTTYTIAWWVSAISNFYTLLLKPFVQSTKTI
jgi:hypothetical protein